MMRSSNGNIFCVIGPLRGESTGHQWIPLTKASDAEHWWLFYLRLNKRLNKQSRWRWFGTPLRTHHDVTVMIISRHLESPSNWNPSSSKTCSFYSFDSTAADVMALCIAAASAPTILILLSRKTNTFIQHIQHNGCWCPGSLRRHDIRSNGVDHTEPDC